MIANVLDRSSRPVIAVDEGADAVQALRTMAARNVRRLVVTSGGRPAGVVTALQILRALAESGPGRRLAVSDVPIEPPVYVRPDAPIIEAVRTMASRGVTSVIVGDEESPLGVFTTYDVVIELAASSYGRRPLAPRASYPSLSPSSSLAEAVEAMAGSGASGAVVRGDDLVMGVVTVRRATMAVSSDAGALSRPLSELPLGPVAYVDVGATASDAARAMLAKGVEVALVYCGGALCGAVDDVALASWLASL